MADRPLTVDEIVAKALAAGDRHRADTLRRLHTRALTELQDVDPDLVEALMEAFRLEFEQQRIDSEKELRALVTGKLSAEKPKETSAGAKKAQAKPEQDGNS